MRIQYTRHVLDLPLVNSRADQEALLLRRGRSHSQQSVRRDAATMATISRRRVLPPVYRGRLRRHWARERFLAWQVDAIRNGQEKEKKKEN